MKIKLSDLNEKQWGRLWRNYHKNIKINEETECWEWTRNIYPDGAGCISLAYVNKKTVHKTAQYASWLLYYGEKPDNLFILHKCDNRKCSNPGHLFLGTQKDNIHDMWVKNRNGGPSAINSRKTHCKNGHPFNKENTSIVSGTTGKKRRRVCKTCRKILWKKSTLHKKSQQNAHTPQ